MPCYNYIGLIILTLVVSCQKDITIEVPIAKNGEQLFIECILFPGEKPQAYISESKPFFDTKVIPQEVFARGAEVTINDGLITDVLKPDSIYDYFRCRYNVYYKGSLTIEKNRTYELNVIYEGDKYVASTNTNQSGISIDSIRYTPEFYDVYGGHDGVIVNFNDVPNEDNYYRFQMNRMIDTSRYHAHILDVLVGQNNCAGDSEFLVKDYGRTIFNDQGGDGLGVEMIVEVSWEYEEGDSTWVFIQSLDKNTAEFYQQIDEQLQSILNPFVEPVLIESKIEGTMGVFGSAIMSDSMLFVYPRDNP